MITTPSPGSVLNRKVPEKVSSSVKEAAIQTGVARAEEFCVLSGLNHCSFLKKKNSWGVGDENFICRG